MDPQYDNIVVEVKIVLMLTVAATLSLGQTSVEGTVVSAANGLPLSKASVLISWNDRSFRDTTDAAGRFVFSAIPAGEYAFSVERPGFAKRDIGLNGFPGRGTLIGDGDHLSGIVLKLQPEGLIAGVVLAPDGKPLPSPLRLWKVAFINRHRMLQEMRRPETYTADADGTFVIGGLEAGRYYIAAREDFAETINEMRHQGLTTTYYPDSTAFERAKPIDVRSGESTRGLQLKVQKTGLYRVSGRGASPASGLTIGERNFWLCSKDPLGQVTFLKPAEPVDNAGMFRIRNVPPGDYVIRGAIKAQSHGQARTFNAEKEIRVADRDVTGMDVVFDARSAKVTGLARGMGRTKPIYASMMETKTGLSTPSEIAADGTFAVELPPGDYRIFSGNAVQMERAAKSILFEGKEVLDTTFPITPAGGAFQIVFAETRKVTGVVRDRSGRPLAGATVALWRNGEAIDISTCDVLGHFTLNVVQEGAFHLAAWEDIDTQTARLGPFLAAFEAQATEVTIKDGAPRPVDLRAIPRNAAEPVIAKLP